ncbi:hypothetical protein UT300005_08830 [Clostridium sp. CTA-5]
MRHNKVLAITLLFLMFFSMPAFAFGEKEKDVLFMGEVQEVQKVEKDNILRVRVKGYIKGGKVYKEEVIGIVGENTMLMPDECFNMKKNNKYEKVNPKELKIEKGDTVFMVLNEAMTKSIPPQAGVKLIQITSQK